jgi:hypothetical protein
MGYALERFVNPENIDPEFICAICHSIFEDPKMIVSCEHIFCNACIVSWKKINREATCPVDRQDIGELCRPFRPFMNVLGRLRLNCRFRGNRCKEVVCLENVMNHEDHQCTAFGKLLSGKFRQEAKKIWRGSLFWEDDNGLQVTVQMKALWSVNNTAFPLAGLRGNGSDGKLAEWPDRLQLHFISDEVLNIEHYLGVNVDRDNVYVRFEEDKGANPANLTLLKNKLSNGCATIRFPGPVCVVQHFARWGTSVFRGLLPKDPINFQHELTYALKMIRESLVD